MTHNVVAIDSIFDVHKTCQLYIRPGIIFKCTCVQSHSNDLPMWEDLVDTIVNDKTAIRLKYRRARLSLLHFVILYVKGFLAPYEV